MAASNSGRSTSELTGVSELHNSSMLQAREMNEVLPSGSYLGPWASWPAQADLQLNLIVFVQLQVWPYSILHH